MRFKKTKGTGFGIEESTSYNASPLGNCDVTCLKESAKFGIRSTCYYVDADVVRFETAAFLTPPMCYFLMDPRIQLSLPFLPSNHGPTTHKLLQLSFSFSSSLLLPINSPPITHFETSTNKPYFSTSLYYLSHLQSSLPFIFSFPPLYNIPNTYKSLLTFFFVSHWVSSIKIIICEFKNMFFFHTPF